MNNLNSVLLEGTLIKDPIVTSENTCTLEISTKRYFKTNDEYSQEVSFFRVDAYGKAAETCIEYLEKGRSIRLVGRLKQNRNNGVSEIVIIAQHIEFRPNAINNKIA